MRRLFARMIALAFLATAGSALAQSSMPDAEYANVQLPDAAKERQAKSLMETIRCVVCQGQSIADSNVQMAGDMRSMIRKRIAAGESPETIRQWLIDRYGSYISYEPPFTGLAAPVWIVPIILLIAGFGIASTRFRKRKA